MGRSLFVRCVAIWVAMAAIAGAQTTPRLKYEQALRELERRNLARAEILLRECIGQQQEPGEKALGKGEVLRYVPQLLLARVLADQGNVDEARRWLQEFERYPAAGQLGGEELLQLWGRLRPLAAPRLVPPLQIDAAEGLCRVRWEAVAGAESYRVESSANASFADAAVARASTRLTSRIVATDLEPGQTLYVRVAAEAGEVTGEYSATATCVRAAGAAGAGFRVEPEGGAVGAGEWVDVKWPDHGGGVTYEVRCLADGQEPGVHTTASPSARCRAPQAGTNLQVEVGAFQGGKPLGSGRAVFSVLGRLQTPSIRWDPAEVTLWWPPVAMAKQYLVRWGRGESADKLFGSIDSCSPRRCQVSIGDLGAGSYALQVTAVSASQSTHLDSLPAQMSVDIPKQETLRAFAQAREFIHAGEYRKGLVALEPLRAEFATSAKFHLYLGIAAFGCERLGEALPEGLGSSASQLAERSFRKTHQLDPTVVFPVEAFGRLFHEAFLRAAPAVSR